MLFGTMIGLGVFQFTPLREGRQIKASIKRFGMDISIHAPPRGATIASGKISQNQLISIHAPPRGATGINTPDDITKLFQFTPLREGRRTRYAVHGAYERFQFTPLREGRPDDHDEQPPQGDISIHAPPRGATSSAGFRQTGWTFQFTPLREGRQQKICNFCKSFVQPLQISMA